MDLGSFLSSAQFKSPKRFTDLATEFRFGIRSVIRTHAQNEGLHLKFSALDHSAIVTLLVPVLL